MVYALQNFRHYLLGASFKMFTDHSALKYLVNKPVLGGRIYRWLLLFQEYDFEIIVKPGKLNTGPDHLSWIDSGEEPSNLEDNLPMHNYFLFRSQMITMMISSSSSLQVWHLLILRSIKGSSWLLKQQISL